jgi:DNA-binding NarL/FixJ family response regulator
VSEARIEQAAATPGGYEGAAARERGDHGPLRVLVADDHPVFLAGIRMVLEQIARVSLVGEATTGTAAVEQARALRPDLVLMDVNMPQMSGIEATRRIRRDSPGTAVVILTMFADDDTLLAAMRAGARGYLLKGAPANEIALAIDLVSRGDAIFGKPVAGRVIEYITDPPSDQYPFPELTDRERAVLDLVAEGLGNATIARRLGLSNKTVRNYMSRIFAKLQVTDRAAAAVRARRAGLGA